MLTVLFILAFFSLPLYMRGNPGGGRDRSIEVLTRPSTQEAATGSFTSTGRFSVLTTSRPVAPLSPLAGAAAVSTGAAAERPPKSSTPTYANILTRPPAQQTPPPQPTHSQESFQLRKLPIEQDNRTTFWSSNKALYKTLLTSFLFSLGMPVCACIRKCIKTEIIQKVLVVESFSFFDGTSNQSFDSFQKQMKS